MHAEGDGGSSGAPGFEAALEAAIAELGDTDAEAARGPIDRDSLRVGLRVGLERPALARLLLEMTTTAAADPALTDAEGTDPEGPGSGSVPVASSMLARSAAMSRQMRVDAGPEVTFGWVTRLGRGDILALGRIVDGMLAGGAPSDIARGFGLAWTGGVKIPRSDLDAMLNEFADLEVAVASILAGRDLRADEPASRAKGSLFDRWMRLGPVHSPAGEAIERSGESGRRGLVAAWNAWIAMRYRTVIPAATYEQLVRPWVTIVGPLPEA